MPQTVEPTQTTRAVSARPALPARGNLAPALMSAALFASASLLSSGPGRAITLLRAETGQWDLTLDQSRKACRVTLRAGPATGGGRGVGMPAGCRKSLPVLAGVETWSLVGEDHINFFDKSGAAVLDFAAQSDDVFAATGPAGETYKLESVEHGLPQRTAAAGETVKTADSGKNPDAGKTLDNAKTADAKKPQGSGAPLRVSDAAGRYTVLRESARDTGCMLTLDDKSAAKGGFRASLAPACRDQGIVIFDPVGWRLTGGRLELTARKGHTASFDLQPDGSWLKDPKQGKSLGLKKQ